MENVKEILKQANQLQEFATNRAEELFKALGGTYRVSVTGIDFEENQITVKFEEITRHDCPDMDWISLDVSQLEMSENKWACYLDEKRTETLAKEQKKKDDAEKAKLEAKQREFARLKNELGY
jgi:Cu/Ag efflux protein CusF